MKKILAVLLAAVIAVSAGVVAYAKGGFLASPSGNASPVVITVEYDEDSCEPRIVVTPYADRDDLDEKRESDMEKAYDEIAANKDLTKLCPELAAVAAALGIDPLNLAVSDLFDVSAYHNGDHTFCGTVTITLSAETLKNFVALIHRNADGKWEHISNAVVDYANNTLTFSVKDFSPFAIVVDKSASDIPVTGEMLVIPAAIMAVSAVSLAGVLLALKKKKQEA